jgi:pSer/pThr/pTyr-binding forkhead associated (FHA) protein
LIRRQLGLWANFRSHSLDARLMRRAESVYLYSRTMADQEPPRLDIPASPVGAPTAAAPFPRLVVVHTPDPQQLGKYLVLSGAGLVIGREAGLEGFVVADRSLSRQHARITRDHGALRVTDAGSRNGTYRNCQRIESEVLQDGDLLRLGDTLLVCEEACPMSELIASLDGQRQGTSALFLVGETGVGKEWLAQRIHERSGRPGAFVSVTCGALPLACGAAEVFGGAERGELPARASQLSAAAGGTLYLEDIAEAAPALQVALVQLLRDAEKQAGVRVLVASQAEASEGVDHLPLRPELAQLLAAVRVDVPPLRRRKAEVLSLAHTFARAEGHGLRMTTDAAEALASWHFPYNLRELRALVRAFIMTRRSRTDLDFGYLVERHPDLARPALERRHAGPLQTSAPTRRISPTRGVGVR